MRPLEPVLVVANLGAFVVLVRLIQLRQLARRATNAVERTATTVPSYARGGYRS